MGGMKTFIVIAVLACSTAKAQSLDTQDQLRVFATCAGRLSAVMEYQWMFDGPASDATKTQRAALLDLIDAIMPPEQDRAVLQWRITAKHAQSALLTRATFNSNPEDAAWAAERAAHFQTECTWFLLG